MTRGGRGCPPIARGDRTIFPGRWALLHKSRRRPYWPTQPGTTMESIKHFIDFSADAGFPYMLIDEGWAVRRGEDRSTGDILAVQPTLDMPAILKYAQDKGVKLWLWAHWASVDRQMDEAFP